MEHPNEGGSYIRQKDGSLVRRVDVAEPPTSSPQPEQKPRAPRTATKDK